MKIKVTVSYQILKDGLLRTEFSIINFENEEQLNAWLAQAPPIHNLNSSVQSFPTPGPDLYGDG